MVIEFLRSRRYLLLAAILLPTFLPSLSPALPRPAEAAASVWLGREDEIEKALRKGEIILMEQLGRGITEPHRATLEYQGQRLRAVWKPLPLHPQKGVRESWAAEVAAYRLSRYLGLDRVPPTVVRRIRSQRGSLQLWIDGVSAFVDIEDPKPPASVWQAEIVRMKAFDVLIDNYDRNKGNLLVDDEWHFVWIDHSRALSFDPRRAKQPEMPTRFDRESIERMAELDKATLQGLIGDLFSRGAIRSVLRQRDRLLEALDAGLERWGEDVYLD